MTYHEHEPDDRRRRIAAAIVEGNPEAETLYETSTSYKAWVDTLTHIIPIWAEGAALRAERADAEENRRRAAMAAFGPGPGLTERLRDPDDVTPGGAP